MSTQWLVNFALYSSEKNSVWIFLKQLLRNSGNTVAGPDAARASEAAEISGQESEGRPYRIS